MSRPRVIRPVTSPFDATAQIPGSKSLSNRALLLAGLAEGTSVLRGVLDADDTRAMAGAIESFGATVDADWETGTISITGIGGAPSGPLSLDANQSGVTGRFLLAAAAVGSGAIEVTGDEQLRARPMTDLTGALTALGARLETSATGGLPVTFASAGLTGGPVQLPGDVSSQFASALLLAGPLTAEGIDVQLEGEVVSTPYLDMTVEVMARFGVEVDAFGAARYGVPPGGYTACELTIEPDASAASYFLAAAAVTASTVRIEGLSTTSVQGDVEFAEVMAQMGATVRHRDNAIELVGPNQLVGVDIDMRDFSDTVPTLAAVAAFASTPTTIRGVGFIRHKESDRLAAMVTELGRVGVRAEETPDGMIIHPSVPQPSVVQTYDDHRIAMSMSVLGLRNPGTRIADPGCVAKTFPRFYEALEALHPDREPLVVVIDGPAGAGKSTVAKAIAERLGLLVLDTGAMYRSVAHSALTRGIDLKDWDAVGDLAAQLRIEVDAGQVLIDGVDATQVIRTAEVSQAVSVVAAQPRVRELLKHQFRSWMVAQGGGVAEGRDMGTVVFPEATLKIFMTADIEERAKRRAAESPDFSYESALADLGRRDEVDSSRAHDPLTEAEDAVTIDSTALSVEQIVDEVIELLADLVRP